MDELAQVLRTIVEHLTGIFAELGKITSKLESLNYHVAELNKNEHLARLGEKLHGVEMDFDQTLGSLHHIETTLEEIQANTSTRKL